MRRPHLNLLLIGGLSAALLAGIGLSHWLQSNTGSSTSRALLLSEARSIPAYSLQTQHGEAYTPDTQAGQWQLLFFGFTHCPDICPNTLAVLRQLKSDLPDTLTQQLEFVFVTVDPARDTADVMREYLAYFDKDFTGVTGSDEAIADFAESVGIAYIKNGEGEDYVMDHSTALVLLDQQSRVKAYLPAPHRLESLKQSLTEIIAP